MNKKLTMVSIHHKGTTYTGFVYLAPKDKLTEKDVFEIVGHSVPRGSTFTPGG